jgi:hypothetical protein
MHKPSSHRRPAALTALRERPSARAWHVTWLGWLLLALVLVPALGRVHQALHIHPQRAAQGMQAVLAIQVGDAGLGHDSAAGGVAEHAHARSRALSNLLPSHASGADCLLLDQLALADVLVAAALGLPPSMAPHVAPSVGAPPVLALHRSLFQARAPPAALRA